MTPIQSTGAGRWHEHAFFLVTITAAAAWLDVLAFVHLGKVFLSFMSGNLLFLGIASGQANGALFARAATALVAFLAGSALGARLGGSRLVPGRGLRRPLLVETLLLAAFALEWATGAGQLPLIATGAAAMGVQAAVALALHIPNVATVAMTATLAQLGALAGWRRSERAGMAPRTLSLTIVLCLAYLVTALVVASVPAEEVLAFGPVALILGAALSPTAGSRAPDRARRTRDHEAGLSGGPARG